MNLHPTGTDSTIEPNIETGGGKRELYFDTRILSNNSVLWSKNKKEQFQCCKQMNEAKKKRDGPTTFHRL